MNAAVISGIRKGDLEPLENNGVKLTLFIAGQNPNVPDEEFIVAAYGQTAEFLQHMTQSGDRIAVFGRISSEKLGTENFHKVISAWHVLAVGDSEKGADFSYAVVSGTADLSDIREAGRSTVMRVDTKNIRVYQDREFTNYVSGSAWGETADAIAAAAGGAPSSGVNIVYDGPVRAGSYQRQDGATIHTADIWIRDYVVGGGAAQAPSTGGYTAGNTSGGYATKSAPPTPSAATLSVDDAPTDDDLPF